MIYFLYYVLFCTFKHLTLSPKLQIALHPIVRFQSKTIVIMFTTNPLKASISIFLLLSLLCSIFMGYPTFMQEENEHFAHRRLAGSSPVVDGSTPVVEDWSPVVEGFRPSIWSDLYQAATERQSPINICAQCIVSPEEKRVSSKIYQAMDESDGMHQSIIMLHGDHEDTKLDDEGVISGEEKNLRMTIIQQCDHKYSVDDKTDKLLIIQGKVRISRVADGQGDGVVKLGGPIRLDEIKMAQDMSAGKGWRTNQGQIQVIVGAEFVVSFAWPEHVQSTMTRDVAMGTVVFPDLLPRDLSSY